MTTDFVRKSGQGRSVKSCNRLAVWGRLRLGSRWKGQLPPRSERDIRGPLNSRLHLRRAERVI